MLKYSYNVRGLLFHRKFSSHDRYDLKFYVKSEFIHKRKRISSVNIPKLKKAGDNMYNYIFGVLDIETFEYNGLLVPYAIGFKFSRNDLKCKYSILKIAYLKDFIKDCKLNYDIEDYKLFYVNMIRTSLLELTSLIPKNKKLYLYVHNLGSFDGYFIFNALIFIFPNEVKFLMDESNKFIEIKFRNIIIRDSYRIFPASLKNLCRFIPNIGNKMDFDHNSVNLSLILKNPYFITDYLENDLNILYNVVSYFIDHLFKFYNINFFKIYSASHLAFTIYRSNFYIGNIPRLNNHQYKLIKYAYYGGNNIMNANYVKDCYYYDVNSLYPYSMINDMPGRFLKYQKDLNHVNFLNHNFFGFYNCIINIPSDIKNKIVISRDLNTNLISYPNGIIKGLYFSEEIKNFIKLGYDVTVLDGFKYSRISNLFSNYVNKFYQLKSESKNLDERFIYKLLLNGLYGYFGRNPIRNITKIMNHEEFVNTSLIYNIIKVKELGNDLYFVKYESKFNNVDMDSLKEYIFSLDSLSKLDNPFKNVNSNMAIASAITSYSRIYMSKFLMDYNIIYSDTDSIITDKTLDPKYIGSDIGLFKLEAHIKEIYILKPKVYAYIDYNDKIVIKSAGIPNELLTLSDFKNAVLYNKSKNVQFNKIVSNYNDFSISNINFTISFNK